MVFCGKYGHLQQKCPDRAAARSTAGSSYATDSPSDEEVLQLEEFNSDKCDFTFESVKGTIIKQGALLNEGVQGNFKPCLQFWQNTLLSPKFVCNVIQRGYFHSKQFPRAPFY